MSGAPVRTARAMRAARGLALASLWIGAAVAQAGDDRAQPLRIAVCDPLAMENACACVEGFAQRKYAALGAFLSNKLHRAVEISCAPTMHLSAANLGAAPDVVIGKTSVVLAESTGPCHLVAKLSDKAGLLTLRGLFVVRGDDPAQKVADLKGRTILFGSTNADENHAAALAALKAAGVDPPARPPTRTACSIAAGEVVDHKADAAVISDYALALLVGCDAVPAGALRIIGHTEDVPFVGAFLVDGSNPQDPANAALVQALLEVKADPALCAALETREGFVPAAAKP